MFDQTIQLKYINSDCGNKVLSINGNVALMNV